MNAYEGKTQAVLYVCVTLRLIIEHDVIALCRDLSVGRVSAWPSYGIWERAADVRWRVGQRHDSAGCCVSLVCQSHKSMQEAKSIVFDGKLIDLKYRQTVYRVTYFAHTGIPRIANSNSIVPNVNWLIIST